MRIRNWYFENHDSFFWICMIPSTISVSAFCVGKPLQLSIPVRLTRGRGCMMVAGHWSLVRVSWGQICSQSLRPGLSPDRSCLGCSHSMCRYFSLQIKCIIIWSECRRRSWSCASSCTPWCCAGDSTSPSTGSSAITSSLSNKDWDFCFVFVWFGQVQALANCRI